MTDEENTYFVKNWRACLCVIIAVAAALRAVGLSRNVFFIDEAFSYVLASHGFGGILRGAMSESNPPLPMFLFHFWQTFGKSEVFLRVLPLLFNVLTVPVVFALARRIRGTSAGLVAAAAFAASAGMVDISLIYRYPALLTLLGGLFVLLYFRSDATNPVFAAASVAALAVVEVAGLYTHYFFIFPVLGVNIVVLWDTAVSRRVPLKRYVVWLAGQAVAAAAFAPWLFAFSQQASKEFAWVPLGRSLAHLAHSLFGAIPKVMLGYLIGPITAEMTVQLVVCVAAMILIGLLFFIADKEFRAPRFRLLAIFAAILFIPYFMMISFNLRLTTLYFCVAAPSFYAILGACASSVNPKLPQKKALFFILATAIVLTIFIYHLEARTAGPDNKAAINFIETHWRDGDVVVVNPTYQASLFEYFATGKLNLFGIPDDFDILKYNFNNKTQVTGKRLRELDSRLGPDGRVWAFMGFGTKTKPDQSELTIRYLREHYRLAGQKNFVPISFSEPVGRLYLFERRGIIKH
jgi:4-amino-4-deoxy-L-arabinose transferase-like glycosyltransferase